MGLNLRNVLLLLSIFRVFPAATPLDVGRCPSGVSWVQSNFTLDDIMGTWYVLRRQSVPYSKCEQVVYSYGVGQTYVEKYLIYSNSGVTWKSSTTLKDDPAIPGKFLINTFRECKCYHFLPCILTRYCIFLVCFKPVARQPI